jgi:glycerol-3-phosphate acyltransferase PlsY
VHAAAALVVAYLLGTVPTAVGVSRIASGGAVDIRTAGSGNPGALNTLGVHGAKWGAVVLLIDTGKAALACVIGRSVGDAVACYAGSLAVIGHCFPVWSRGRGGKGIACAGGQCLATFPVFAPVALGVAVMSSRRRVESLTLHAGVATVVVWVEAAALWVALGWPNAWGVPAAAPLVISAALSGAVIVYKFEAAR